MLKCSVGSNPSWQLGAKVCFHVLFKSCEQAHGVLMTELFKHTSCLVTEPETQLLGAYELQKRGLYGKGQVCLADVCACSYTCMVPSWVSV